MLGHIFDANRRLREEMTRLVADGREARAKLREERRRSRELCDRAGRSLREPSKLEDLPSSGPGEARSGDPK
jgi:hypothetical protein